MNAPKYVEIVEHPQRMQKFTVWLHDYSHVNPDCQHVCCGFRETEAEALKLVRGSQKTKFLEVRRNCRSRL